MTTSISFLLLMSLLALTACEQSPKVDDRGFLYFGSGRYLGKLDLSDGSSSIAANAGDVNIVEVSAGRDNTVLLSVTAPGGYVQVDRILRVDVTTGQRAALYEGGMARYLPGPKTVIYDTGHQLLTVGIRTDNPVIFTHHQNDVTAIVVISPDEILFESRDEMASRIYLYNGRSEEMSEQPALSVLCELDAAVWVDDRESLACKSRQTGNYVLTNIEATASEQLKLPRGKDFRALAYAADRQSIIFAEKSRSWLAGRPQTAIWSYALQTGDSERLIKDQELGDSVVYSQY